MSDSEQIATLPTNRGGHIKISTKPVWILEISFPLLFVFDYSILSKLSHN